MALIAGNTLSNLSRNSLVDDASRQNTFENSMNRARRAYEYENLSAQDRERTNQLMADLALRRELGLGDIGVRNRAVDVQRDVGMGDIGVRRDIGMADINLRGELGRGDLAYKNQLLGIEKDLRGKGLEIDADRVRAQREAIASGERVGMAQVGSSLAPYIYGETEAQRNDRALREMAIRGQFDLGKLGLDVDRSRVASAERVGTLNAMTPLAPWMYGQTEAQRQAGRLQEMTLNNQLAIGVMPYTRPTAGEALNWDVQNRMLEGGGPEARNLTNVSLATARSGNIMLNSARDAAFGALVQDIDSQWFTSPTEALAAADAIRKSIDAGTSANGLNLSGRTLEAARKYEASVANARDDVLNALGEGRGYVEYAGGRFNAIDYRPGVTRQQIGGASSAGTEQQLAGPPAGEARTRVIAGGIVEDRLPDGTWVRRQQSPPSSQQTPQVQQAPNGFLGNVRRASQEFWGSVVPGAGGALTPAWYGAASRILPSASDVDAYITGRGRNYRLLSEAPLPPIEPPQYQAAPDFGLPPVEPRYTEGNYDVVYSGDNQPIQPNNTQPNNTKQNKRVVVTFGQRDPMYYSGDPLVAPNNFVNTNTFGSGYLLPPIGR